ncbi:MAG: serine hydrolase [Pseudomonadales bacterium]|nr:serine hydrolase [Pseudomonadales bacterium]
MGLVNPESVGLSGERLERVSQWLQEQVDGGRLAGCSVLIGRRGQIVFSEAVGEADQELGKSFSEDTIVRMFSMTKAITTVAAMQLYERGAFQLDDPIAKYIPEFADTPVWKGGALENVEPQATPITVRHLMTHTSGLTYGFMQTNPVDAEYREQKLEFSSDTGTLAEVVKKLAAVPLICQPGSQWNYSVSSDVLGRLVEIWSGDSLALYFCENIFAPLAMHDTGFHVVEENHPRFAALYSPLSGANMANVAKTGQNNSAQTEERSGLKLQESSLESRYLSETELHSGGGGLTGSIGDYGRFCQMLLNGGELDGTRLLGCKTVEYMRLNHLPDNQDMAAMGQPVWSETSYDGIGFGLGFAVVIDPVEAHIITSPGEHHWGGAASTFFWIDPEEDLFVVFFTQLIPSSTYPIRRELRTAVYQAIVD